jgi:hypothetical protein
MAACPLDQGNRAGPGRRPGGEAGSGEQDSLRRGFHNLLVRNNSPLPGAHPPLARAAPPGSRIQPTVSRREMAGCPLDQAERGIPGRRRGGRAPESKRPCAGNSITYWYETIPPALAGSPCWGAFGSAWLPDPGHRFSPRDGRRSAAPGRASKARAAPRQGRALASKIPCAGDSITCSYATISPWLEHNSAGARSALPGHAIKPSARDTPGVCCSTDEACPPCRPGSRRPIAAWAAQLRCRVAMSCRAGPWRLADSFAGTRVSY